MESKMTTTEGSIDLFSEFEKSSIGSFSNNVLPVLDNLSQYFFPFQWIEWIQIFLCILQLFQTSFWPAGGKFWGNTKISNILHYMTYYSSFHEGHTSNFLVYGIMIGIIFIIFALFCYLLFHYKKTRRIVRPIMHLINIYFILIGAIVIHSLASLVGHLINEIIENHTYENLIMLFLGFIAYIISELFFYFKQIYSNQSIYIRKSLWHTFDSTSILFLMIVNPQFLILGHLFKYYPKWSFGILVAFHILMIIYCFSIILIAPFITNTSNILILSLLSSTLFNDLFRIIVEFYPIKHYVFILVCVLVFAVFVVIYFILLKLLTRKVCDNLSYTNLLNLEVIDDVEKFNYFTELKLDLDIKKAKTYLIIGFKSNSDLFKDFSLIKFCFESYKENSSMLTLLIQLTSYFKQEKTMLDMLLKQFHFLPSCTPYEKFIYYQAFKVKMFRHSTSTTLSTTLLNELSSKTIDLENQIKSFWAQEKASYFTLDTLERQQRFLSNLWNESIEDNWSSVSYRDEHIRFLIESCTDFKKAVLMTHLKDKIDTLAKERNDLCYMSLIFCFPAYLELEFESDFLDKKSSSFDISPSPSFSSSSPHNYDFLSTNTSDNDITQEEEIANSIVSYGRLRLSMQNGLSYVRPSTEKIFVVYSLVSIIASVVALVTIFAYYYSFYNSMNDWNDEIGGLIEMRSSFINSFLSLSILYGQETKKFLRSKIPCNYSIDRDEVFFDHNGQFDKASIQYVETAKEMFSELMNTILELGLRRTDISTLTDLLFQPSIRSNTCFEGEIVDTMNWTMEQSINFGILSFSVMAEDKDFDLWYTNNSLWCHDITIFPDMQNMLSEIQNALAEDIYNQSSDISSSIFIQMLVIGPVYFVVFFIPLPVLINFYLAEINKLIKVMLATDQEHKEQAQNFIALNKYSDNNYVPSVPHVPFNWHYFILAISNFIFFCLFILFVELILQKARSLCSELNIIGFWSCYFQLMRCCLSETILEIINAVYLTNIEQKYIDLQDFKNRINNLLTRTETIFTEIIYETPSTPSYLNIDDEINSLILSSMCEPPETLTVMHDAYKCSSLTPIFSFIHSLIFKILQEMDNYDGTFSGEELSNIYHLIFAHGIALITKINTRFIEIHNELISDYKIEILIYFFMALLCILVFTFILIYSIFNLKHIFNMAICIIRRLSPTDFISNSELINCLLYKKGEEIEMGVTHTIFNNSFDGILCLNFDGTVEILNKSFANDYGYSPEQLIGQLVGTIFDDESREKLENQMKLMKNHESSNYSDHLICFTNDGRPIPSYVTLFAIKGNERSLILVIRDETLLLQKKSQLELAKKKSQDLLEQIMPPKILQMLKEGKSEISFAVPSASVMFINLVNFSGFSADLSPQQIMGTLSSLFGAFDIWIQKYPLMTKIKLIGDSYMAACGLFTPKEDPQNHAFQAIDFALHSLCILEDTNIKLNFNLQVRIGINTDGPIIAGVLGTENRVFDIIGDTINVASRLEHKAEPGHIMMSEKTYDLVKDHGYNIVPKGEVFLKGKGNMPAFSI